MATLEEVLAEVRDDYLYDPIQFVIDENLRTISVPSNGVVFGVVEDKNVNYINFQANRYYNGFDMSTFQFRINYVNANGNMNYYDVTDVTLSEDDIIRFTWLLESDVTAYVGNVMFSVQLFKLNGSEITQNFHTTNATGKVLDGITVNQHITPEQQRDLLSHFYELMDQYVASKADDIVEECKPAIDQYVASKSEETITNYVITHKEELKGENYKVEVITSDGIDIELQPNKFYSLGIKEELHIGLGQSITGVLNEYMFEFISGETPTNFSYDITSITFMEEPTIEAKKKYQCSIVNGIGLIVGVAYE